ncbi:MAG: hypothetical protein ABI680_16195 [Chthoniobacteraceae bacterium]
MNKILLALSAPILFAGCAGVKVVDTQVATGAVNPHGIYIRPFDVRSTEYTGDHRGGPGEKPVRQSLAGRAFADALKVEMEKMAPAMVIEANEQAPSGWLVEGSLDVVDGGKIAGRASFYDIFGAGRSQVLIHVRIRDMSGGSSGDDKDSGTLARRGDVIYEFDLSGGSRLTGRHGGITAPGLGDAEPFDFKNAAERVMIALSTDPYRYGLRSSPVIR